MQVFKRILTQAIAKNDADEASKKHKKTAARETEKKSEATSDAGNIPEHEETLACGQELQHVDMPNHLSLPAKWRKLKSEFDLRVGYASQINWDTICRETNASDACYDYLAGQLTGNARAPAKDKAAQLKLALNDGWKQYRTKAGQHGMKNSVETKKQCGPTSGLAHTAQPEKRHGQEQHEPMELDDARKEWDEWFTVRALRKWFLETHRETCRL